MAACNVRASAGAWEKTHEFNELMLLAANRADCNGGHPANLAACRAGKPELAAECGGHGGAGSRQL
jgi:hypothetical protein